MLTIPYATLMVFNSCISCEQMDNVMTDPDPLCDVGMLKVFGTKGTPCLILSTHPLFSLAIYM